jgi:hypothetical protein
VQGIKLLGDLKLGQYLKIPPKVNFVVQILGCIVGALLNYVMMCVRLLRLVPFIILICFVCRLSIIDKQRPALLSISGTRLWSGQNAQSYNSNAIAWGALGKEMFRAGSIYQYILTCPCSHAGLLILPCTDGSPPHSASAACCPSPATFCGACILRTPSSVTSIRGSSSSEHPFIHSRLRPVRS